MATVDIRPEREVVWHSFASSIFGGAAPLSFGAGSIGGAQPAFAAAFAPEQHVTGPNGHAGPGYAPAELDQLAPPHPTSRRRSRRISAAVVDADMDSDEAELTRDDAEFEPPRGHEPDEPIARSGRGRKRAQMPGATQLPASSGNAVVVGGAASCQNCCASTSRETGLTGQPRLSLRSGVADPRTSCSATRVGCVFGRCWVETRAKLRSRRSRRGRSAITWPMAPLMRPQLYFRLHKKHRPKTFGPSLTAPSAPKASAVSTAAPQLPINGKHGKQTDQFLPDGDVDCTNCAATDTPSPFATLATALTHRSVASPRHASRLQCVDRRA